ncbi:dTDP-glucose 4,6-dehydratase, partial [Candidatus Woesearchaeota archaeon]|nr:dTDP-glucose 4,6-dehydratase [Candidatus Woesearchaeota archaeon]
DNSWIQTIPHRKGHDFRYALNTEKIKKLGWKPEVSFEEGMGKTIEWYKENKGWWEPLKNKKKF